MDLIDYEVKRTLRREEAAAWLHQLADSLARHNNVQFQRDGQRYTVAVPDQVTLEVEIEIGDEGGGLEIELSW